MKEEAWENPLKVKAAEAEARKKRYKEKVVWLIKEKQLFKV